MTLWTVVDEDLLRYLCYGETPISVGCDGFVGGCWFRDIGLVVDADDLLMPPAVLIS